MNFDFRVSAENDLLLLKGQYFAMVVILLSSSTVCTVLVITIHYRGWIRGDIPGPLRRLVFEWLPPFICLQTPVQMMLQAMESPPAEVLALGYMHIEDIIAADTLYVM